MSCPKPMLRYQGKPILAHIVAGDFWRRASAEIFIVTGWRAEVVEIISATGRNGTRASRLAGRSCRTGTGKAPELAKEFIGDSPFS